mmetsp:Transcript_24232/g.37356  ORF Transcript_24232/g.37356 Transcript_24232/m.37356 type:complete len:96 (+) Transcript_24232:115-402(+)|eukprot:CAMPEP_0170484662 /NCGR_PEP_ID=MMETSP0208-20121228/4070_1 /TAXON_ID=197538 /ORGANISM="Strombidium inclinatum, Strain S3" /LENGTH=95 /DNA_ID=CAMNT_0010758039 /DNA_START=110 /DNA_END=397 /DNA_ORIENTATION=-
MTVDKHYMRIFSIHQKARSHSYLNIGWMAFTACLTLYFAKYLFLVEQDVSCIAAKRKEMFQQSDEIQYKFKRFDSVSDISIDEVSDFESIQDVSS